MKVEKFLIEYANHKKQLTADCEKMKEEEKVRAIIKIDHALSARKKGLTTVDETIMNILNCCE